MDKRNMVCIKVKNGCLAFDVLHKSHMAHKFVEDGRTLYEVWYGGYRFCFSSEDVIEHERYFLVYVKSEATQDNPSYAGRVHKYLYGKGNELLFTDSPEINGYTKRYGKLFASDIREYGYTRRQDAKRCYSYTHTDNNGYWTSKAYIVEYDVCGSEVTEV